MKAHDEYIVSHRIVLYVLIVQIRGEKSVPILNQKLHIHCSTVNNSQSGFTNFESKFNIIALMVRKFMNLFLNFRNKYLTMRFKNARIYSIPRNRTKLLLLFQANILFKSFEIDTDVDRVQVNYYKTIFIYLNTKAHTKKKKCVSHRI
jgi:hypothetical protein